MFSPCVKAHAGEIIRATNSHVSFTLIDRGKIDLRGMGSRSASRISSKRGLRVVRQPSLAARLLDPINESFHKKEWEHCEQTARFCVSINLD